MTSTIRSFEEERIAQHPADRDERIEILGHAADGREGRAEDQAVGRRLQPVATGAPELLAVASAAAPSDSPQEIEASRMDPELTGSEVLDRPGRRPGGPPPSDAPR